MTHISHMIGQICMQTDGLILLCARYLGLGYSLGRVYLLTRQITVSPRVLIACCGYLFGSVPRPTPSVTAWADD